MSEAISQRLLTLINRIGTDPNEDNDLRIRRMIFVGASLAGVPALVLYGVLFSVLGAPLAAAVMFVYLAICIMNLIAYAIIGRHFRKFFFILLITNMTVSPLITIVLGGVIPSAMHAVWGLLSPLGVLVVYGPRAGLRWFVGYVGVILIATYVSYSNIGPFNSLHPETISAVIGLNIIGASAFAFGILYYFVQQRGSRLSLVARRARALGRTSTQYLAKRRCRDTEKRAPHYCRSFYRRHYPVCRRCQFYIHLGKVAAKRARGLAKRGFFAF